MIKVDKKILCEYCFAQTGREPCPECGFDHRTYVCDPMTLKAGSIVAGRYAIGRVIGKGGFGVTYLAYDLKLGCRVAVKEYYPYGLAARIPGSTQVSVSDAKETFRSGAEKFYDEARLVAQFNGNPNIVSVHDVFYENNTVYFTMGYLDGQTLKDYLREHGALSPGQAVYVADAVTNALAAAHGRDVLHRDISPDNIMVCRDGTVKLLDFGAARQVMKDGSQSLSVILKQGFAPLEQYQKKGKQGPWTDIYSLGATLYHALTLDTLDDPMSRLEGDEEYHSNVHGIAEGLWRIIKKATMLKSADRYQDVFELRKDLDSLPIGPVPLAEAGGRHQAAADARSGETHAASAGMTGSAGVSSGAAGEEGVRACSGAAAVEDIGVTMPLQEEDVGVTMPLQEDDVGVTMPLREDDIRVAMPPQEGDVGMAMPRQKSDAAVTMPLQEDDVGVTMPLREDDIRVAMPPQEGDVGMAIPWQKSDAAVAMPQRESDVGATRPSQEEKDAGNSNAAAGVWENGAGIWSKKYGIWAAAICLVIQSVVAVIVANITYASMKNSGAIERVYSWYRLHGEVESLYAECLFALFSAVAVVGGVIFFALTTYFSSRNGKAGQRMKMKIVWLAGIAIQIVAGIVTVEKMMSIFARYRYEATLRVTLLGFVVALLEGAAVCIWDIFFAGKIFREGKKYGGKCHRIIDYMIVLTYFGYIVLNFMILYFDRLGGRRSNSMTSVTLMNDRIFIHLCCELIILGILCLFSLKKSRICAVLAGVAGVLNTAYWFWYFGGLWDYLDLEIGLFLLLPMIVLAALTAAAVFFTFRSQGDQESHPQPPGGTGATTYS